MSMGWYGAGATSRFSFVIKMNSHWEILDIFVAFRILHWEFGKTRKAHPRQAGHMDDMFTFHTLDVDPNINLIHDYFRSSRSEYIEVAEALGDAPRTKTQPYLRCTGTTSIYYICSSVVLIGAQKWNDKVCSTVAWCVQNSVARPFTTIAPKRLLWQHPLQFFFISVSAMEQYVFEFVFSSSSSFIL